MGNEMGNNNTSGLREEDNTAQDKSQQEVAHADDLKDQNHVIPVTQDKDSQGREDPNTDDKKVDNKDDDIKDEDKKSLQEADRKDDEKVQNHEILASEDKHEEETGLASTNLEGVAELCNHHQKQEEKEENYNMIPETTEKCHQETAYAADEAKVQNPLVPSAEGENSHGNEKELVSSKADHGVVSPNIDNQKDHEKDTDNPSTKAGEIPLQEADSTVEKETEAHLVSEDGDKDNLDIGTVLVSSDHDGMAYPGVDNPKQDEKEEGTNIADEAKEKSSQEAATADVVEIQDHLVPAVEDENTPENEIGSVSSDPEIKGLHGDNTKLHEKEEGKTDDLKGQNHAIPVTQDKDSQGREAGLVSGYDVGREDPNTDDQKVDNKDDDIKNEDKKSLQDADRKDDEKEQNHEVLVSEDRHEEETGLASTNLEGVAELRNDNQKQDDKEEDYKMIPETMEKTLQEAVYAADETKGQDPLVPAAESENSHGNETELVSSKANGIASPNIDNQKDHEKDTNNTSTKAEETPLQEADSTVETKTDAHLVSEDGDENNLGIETGLVSSDHYGRAYPGVNNPRQDEKEEDTNIADEVKEKSSQEDATTDVVEIQDHLAPAVEDENTPGNQILSVSSDPEVTDLHGDNTKLHEKDEGKTDAEHLPKDDHADDIEEKILTIPAAEGKDCNKTEVEAEAEAGAEAEAEVGVEAEPSEAFDEGREIQPDSSSKNMEDQEMQKEPNFKENLSVISHHSDNQSSLMKEDEGTGNSSSDAASSTSHDPVPQEPAVLEPKEHELTKINSEQLVQVCNGTLKSEDMIIPSLTCQDQENGFISNSGISTDMVEFPDPSPVKEMATKELTSEGTDLPNGVAANCNGEFPSEMNSMKNDSPEPQVEAYPLDEMQNFSLEVLKDMDVSEKATLVSEESENGNTQHFHLQIQPGEEKIIENGDLVDDSISNQNEAAEEKQNDTQKEVLLITDPSMISADTFLTDQKYREDYSEEKKMIEETLEKMEDSRENGGKCISSSYPIEQAEAFLSQSPQKLQQDTHIECKKVQNSNESMVELKQESSGEFSTAEAPPFATQNLTERNVVSSVELADQKPLWGLSESPKPETKPSVKQSNEQCAIGRIPADHYQPDSVGRFSTESNPDNMSIHAQMRKSPSFDLNLRVEARAEESDQTPLLFQDKTTIESIASQGGVTDVSGKPAADTEYAKNSLQYEAMAAEEKVVTLERSDSERSKTPFLGLLKEEEDADQMLIPPKKQDNQSAANKATTKVNSAKEASTKGKGKRKPRTSLFGTCMCCATVIN